jgi:brefeldin A-inhibited guanine nucleotide-exchange protein
VRFQNKIKWKYFYCFFRTLSLELILNILQNSGPAFRTGDKFIYAIRQYLCVSLLTNCTSQVAQITGLSLQIFVVVMANFKDHLKSELEVFVSTIFLKILESENSTYDHKCRVLEVFQNICRDPCALVELFINYDCDLDAINLFSRFVAGFAKIAKVYDLILLLK